MTALLKPCTGCATPLHQLCTSGSWEQRHLILECKVWIFKNVIHQDNEFAHDGGELNFGGFTSRAEPPLKLFELPVSPPKIIGKR